MPTKPKVPVKKGRKFREGGSVMDTPSRDMRDPAYRKQLEKEQAIEPDTTDIELLVSGFGTGKALRGMYKDLKGTLQARSSKPFDVEIGSKTPEAIYKKEYARLRRMADDALAEGRKIPEKEIEEKAQYWTNYELKKQKKPLPSRSEQTKNELSNALKKTTHRALILQSAETAPRALKKLTGTEEEPSSMKKGGLAKKPKQSGGRMKPVDKAKNPGLAKLPTAVRNKMGYMKAGGMAKKKAAVPKARVKRGRTR